MVYYNISHNLDQPNIKATIENRKQLPKQLKPQIINPQSYTLSHQMDTTFKILIKMFDKAIE